MVKRALDPSDPSVMAPNKLKRAVKTDTVQDSSDLKPFDTVYELQSLLSDENVEVKHLALRRLLQQLQRERDDGEGQRDISEQAPAEIGCMKGTLLLVHQLFQSYPDLEPFFQFWQLVDQENTQSQAYEWQRCTLISALAQLLRLSRPAHRAAQARVVVKRILQFKLKSVLKQMGLNNPKLVGSVLELLKSMCLQSPTSSRDLQAVFPLHSKSILRWLQIRKSAVRYKWIDIVIGFLKLGDTRSRKSLLEQRDIVNYIFNGLAEDPTAKLMEFFTVLRDIVSDFNLPRTLRLSPLRAGNMEYVVKLLNHEDQTKVQVAYDFLSFACCQPGIGLCSQSNYWFVVRNKPKSDTDMLDAQASSQDPVDSKVNKHLIVVLEKLRPLVDENQRKLWLAIVSAAPDALLHVWKKSHSSVFEPRPDILWLNNMHLALQIIERSPPSLSLPQSLGVTDYRVDANRLSQLIMPAPFNRLIWSKGLQHKSITVRHVVSGLLSAVFDKCSAIIKELQDTEFLTQAEKDNLVNTIMLEIRRRLPEFQTIVAAFKAAKNGGAPDAEPETEQVGDTIDVQLGNQEPMVDEEFSETKDGRQLSLQILRLMKCYQTHVEDLVTDSRYDFAKILDDANVEDVMDPYQAEFMKLTVEILSGAASSFHWQSKPNSTQTTSYVGWFARVAAKTNILDLSQSIKRLLVAILENVFVFRHNICELPIWIDTMLSSSEDFVSFLDSCILDGSKNIHRLIDDYQVLLELAFTKYEQSSITDGVLQVYLQKLKNCMYSTGVISIEKILPTYFWTTDSTSDETPILPFSPILLIVLKNLPHAKSLSKELVNQLAKVLCQVQYSTQILPDLLAHFMRSYGEQYKLVPIVEQLIVAFEQQCDLLNQTSTDDFDCGTDENRLNYHNYIFQKSVHSTSTEAFKEAFTILQRDSRVFKKNDFKLASAHILCNHPVMLSNWENPVLKEFISCGLNQIAMELNGTPSKRQCFDRWISYFIQTISNPEDLKPSFIQLLSGCLDILNESEQSLIINRAIICLSSFTALRSVLDSLHWHRFDLDVKTVGRLFGECQKDSRYSEILVYLFSKCVIRMEVADEILRRFSNVKDYNALLSLLKVCSETYLTMHPLSVQRYRFLNECQVVAQHLDETVSHWQLFHIYMGSKIKVRVLTLSENEFVRGLASHLVKNATFDTEFEQEYACDLLTMNQNIGVLSKCSEKELRHFVDKVSQSSNLLLRVLCASECLDKLQFVEQTVKNVMDKLTVWVKQNKKSVLADKPNYFKYFMQLIDLLETKSIKLRLRDDQYRNSFHSFLVSGLKYRFTDVQFVDLMRLLTKVLYISMSKDTYPISLSILVKMITNHSKFLEITKTVHVSESFGSRAYQKILPTDPDLCTCPLPVSATFELQKLRLAIFSFLRDLFDLESRQTSSNEESLFTTSYLKFFLAHYSGSTTAIDGVLADIFNIYEMKCGMSIMPALLTHGSLGWSPFETKATGEAWTLLDQIQPKWMMASVMHFEDGSADPNEFDIPYYSPNWMLPMLAHYVHAHLPEASILQGEVDYTDSETEVPKFDLNRFIESNALSFVIVGWSSHKSSTRALCKSMLDRIWPLFEYSDVISSVQNDYECLLRRRNNSTSDKQHEDSTYPKDSSRRQQARRAYMQRQLDRQSRFGSSGNTVANRILSSLKEHRREMFLLLHSFQKAITSYGNKDTEENSAPRLPFMISLFFAVSVKSVLAPESDLYERIFRLLTRKTAFDWKDVPLFLTLYYSDKEKACQHERLYTLQLIACGLRTPEDWKLLQRRKLMDILVSFDLGPGGETMVALQMAIILRVCRLPCSLDFLTQSKLLAFIRCAQAQNGFREKALLALVQQLSRCIQYYLNEEQQQKMIHTENDLIMEPLESSDAESSQDGLSDLSSDDDVIDEDINTVLKVDPKFIKNNDLLVAPDLSSESDFSLSSSDTECSNELVKDSNKQISPQVKLKSLPIRLWRAHLQSLMSQIRAIIYDVECPSIKLSQAWALLEAQVDTEVDSVDLA